MAKLNSFTFISLNGYYKDLDHDTVWHNHGEEESAYSEESLKPDNILLFGRKTYEMMNSFWPTDMAYELFPEVAKGMNKAEKLVVSKSLSSCDWNNARILEGELVSAIQRLKEESKKNISILGSGEILSQLAQASLIDEYQFMIDPILLKGGFPIFDKISVNLKLQLIDHRVFTNGTLLLKYKSNHYD